MLCFDWMLVGGEQEEGPRERQPLPVWDRYQSPARAQLVLASSGFGPWMVLRKVVCIFDFEGPRVKRGE